MANIAEAAGVSRPALYQYFSDKEDIFAAAFAKVFEERVAAAEAGMASANSHFGALDTMLQRFEGDLWELTYSSPHHDELLEAKSGVVMEAVQAELNRLWVIVEDYLASIVPGNAKARVALRADWLDMLTWSPRGLKLDEPDLATYRRRLTALARSIASEINQELG